MNRDELRRFAELYALKKAVDALVDSKGGTLYGELRDDMRQLYEDADVKSREVIIEDQDGNRTKVGTVSAVTTTAKTRHVLYPLDLASYAMWLATDGLGYFRDFMTQRQRSSRELLDISANALIVDGVVPDGCEVRMETTPTTFRGIKVTGCDLADVVAASGRELPEVMASVLALPGE